MQIRPVLAATMVALIVLALVAGSSSTSASGPDNFITQLAEDGESSSLALDANGYPVVAYSDFFASDLKILHCDDPHCIGMESITSFDVGLFPSLVLDANGYPVVSYLGNSGFLKVMHCNDANCSGADESIVAVDAIGGLFTPSAPSLQLDALGYPVVTYQAQTSGALTVLHCNDPNCAGGDESITSPDTCCESSSSSLRLDSSGNPVVSYQANGLKIMHCNDPDCSGGDETFASPDGALGGAGTSLALDLDGYPVVSYFQGAWKLLHCGDANCSSSNSISLLESIADGSGFASKLVLDAAGNPVIVYAFGFPHPTASRLRLAHCNDPDCANGDEAIVTLPEGGSRSLALDSLGNPVLTITAGSSLDLPIELLLFYCGDANCGFKAPTPAPVGGVAHHQELRGLSANTPQSSELDSAVLVTGGTLIILASLGGATWWARRRSRMLTNRRVELY